MMIFQMSQHRDVFDVPREKGQVLLLLAQLTAEVSGLVDQVQDKALSNREEMRSCLVNPDRIDCRCHKETYFVLFDFLIQACDCSVGCGEILLKTCNVYSLEKGWRKF